MTERTHRSWRSSAARSRAEVGEARYPLRILTVEHPVTHYTVAVGPPRPGRQDRIVAVIGETLDSSVFRWAGDEETVFRIAAEVGVRRDKIQWEISAFDA
jgi:hypothetical protein